MYVSAKEHHQYPWFIRLFFWKQKKKYGKVLDPALLWGRSPWVFATLALLYGALDRKSSPLSPALRSLITVRVSQINHCTFCCDINAATLLKRGVSVEKVEALHSWRTSELFSPLEVIVLDYVEAVTRSDRDVTPEMMSALSQHFDQDGLVELTGLIAFQNMSSKFNASLDVAPQGFCTLPNIDKAD